MPYIKEIILWTLIATGTVSCSSIVKTDSYISSGEYKEIIDSHSDIKRGYSGPYTKFNIRVTFLNSKVREAQLKRLRTLRQWDDITFQKERHESERELRSKTSFFVFLYTPQTKNKNLFQGRHTPWNLFLIHNNHRYKVKVTSSHLPNHETEALYPNQYSRFHKAYKITFELPSSQVEKGSLELVLTGALGKSKMTF